MAGFSKIVADAFGSPDVLRLRHVDTLPEPGAGEVRLRVEAAGVGYTDTIVRRGRYMAYTGGLPVTPGYDVVGIVDKLGPDVAGVQLGDRVADMPVTGSYTQYLLRPAEDLVPVPANVSPAAAVDVPLMWMTAWQMLTRSVSLPPGSIILAVSASGAVGRGLVVLARHLGLRVIGTCSAAKLSLVEQLGATALDYDAPNLAAAIRHASGGGVAAAFDAMGGQSWQTSWDALAAGGTLVGYGMQNFLESGAPPAEAIASMRQISQGWKEAGKTDGSGRTTAFYDIQTRRRTHPAEYRADAIQLLGLIADGSVAPPAARIMPLGEAAEAHRLVAGGTLRTRLVLQP